MKHLLVFFISISISFIAFSQTDDISTISASQLKTLATNAIRLGDTYSAIDYLEAYCAKKEDAQMMFLLAESYRNARNYSKAKKWYEAAYRKNAKKYTVALYHYATMLKTEQKYDEALVEFKKFRREYRGIKDKSGVDYARLARSQIEACEKANYIIDSAITVKIEHLSSTINKASIEFAPQYISDSILLYAAFRADTVVYKITEGEEDTSPKRQFYLAKKNNNSWEYLFPWPEGTFNNPAIETGNGSFSPDKQRFYFTRCTLNRKMKTICSIYVSYRDGKEWTEPEALPEIINSKKYTSTQPTVGSDSKRGEEVLYFVSDRPGGRGGLDIWYSQYDSRKKTWKEVRNAGPRVNSAGDECTPFYDNKSRTLYFSSNGFPGLGELDIFRTVGELSKWADVAENLGYPINSEFDDLYYVTHTNQKEGFFTSNRTGTITVMHDNCCDDLFSYEYIGGIDLAVDGKVYEIKNERVSSILQGKLEIAQDTILSETNYIQGAIVSLFIVDRTSKDLIYIAQDTTTVEGEYFFTIEPNKNYVLTFENDKEKARKHAFSTHGYITSDTIHIHDIGIEYISREPIVIKNIYYEFDHYKLTQAAKNTIDTTLVLLLQEAPEIIIELSSHTDSKGDDDYNMKLSERRAKSVVNYLIQKGIDKTRLYPKGYGKTKPIAPNTHADGRDNPEGRQMNRRTEFKVIGTLQQYSEIIYQE